MVKSMVDIRTVAKYYLSKESMAHKKLEKLCYYAQAWHLANHGIPMMPNRFEAWIHGPVSPDLYVQYKNWGWAQIPMNIDNSELFTHVEIDLMDRIYDTYGNYTKEKLEYLSCNELPWMNARQHSGQSYYSRNPISIKDMRDYYGERIGKEYA